VGVIMGKIDVWDLDVSISKYICKGLKKYIKENEKAAFPTAPNYTFFENLNENATLEERVKEWHIILHEIAEKFKTFANNKYNGITDEEIEDAFDSLKKVFRYLWI
jgi:hypothetical protein